MDYLSKVEMTKYIKRLIQSEMESEDVYKYYPNITTITLEQLLESIYNGLTNGY